VTASAQAPARRDHRHRARVPRTAIASAPSSRSPIDQEGDNSDAHDVGCGAQGDLCADAAVLFQDMIPTTESGQEDDLDIG
jgi:hypothetical protein